MTAEDPPPSATARTTPGGVSASEDHSTTKRVGRQRRERATRQLALVSGEPRDSAQDRGQDVAGGVVSSFNVLAFVDDLAALCVDIFVNERVENNKQEKK